MRLYVILAAVALFLGAGVYVVQLQKKASRVDSAETALQAEREARSLEQAKYLSDLKDSEEARKALASGLEAITERFNSIQIPKTLTKTVEVPGACPRVGAGPDFVRVWNDASSPSPAP